MFREFREFRADRHLRQGQQRQGTAELTLGHRLSAIQPGVAIGGNRFGHPFIELGDQVFRSPVISSSLAPTWSFPMQLVATPGDTRIAKVTVVDWDGTFSYDNFASFHSKSAVSLRIARHGSNFTLLGKATNSDSERVIGAVELSNVAISQARVMLHTGGVERESEVVVKQLEIRADQYQ